MNNDEKREQEVLKCLKSSNRTNDMVCIFPKTDHDQGTGEIQQYREIGTVERFQQLAEQFKPHVTDKTSCPERHCNKCDKYRKENEKYHEIGTVEECREAMERHRAKKPNKNADRYTDFVQHYFCPVCGRYFGQAGVHNAILFDKPKYCICGQAIDWGDENE